MEFVSEEMRNRIKEELGKIEEEEDVTIIYACESGSRAWGFPSTDSDYDVRFIYVRSSHWYMNIDEGRDVIEKPIDDKLDISGWDIKKAFKLLRKSNPPLFEWLNSPIKYVERTEYPEIIRKMSTEVFRELSAIHHYTHMASGNFRQYLQGESVNLKKYLYVIRPILAALWVDRFKEMAPMKFTDLVDRLVYPEGSLDREIRELLQRKMSGEELNEGPKYPAIDEFIREHLEGLKALGSSYQQRDIADPTESLNNMFYSLVTGLERIRKAGVPINNLV